MRLRFHNSVPPPIPGTRWWSDSSTLEGPPDAIEAAGGHAPPPPPAIVKLPKHIAWREYQAEGIRQMLGILLQHHGGLLADDMGLGKTPQGAAIAYALGQPTLVVCPAGVRHQWADWMRKVGTASDKHSCAVLGPPSDKEFTDHWHHWKTRVTPYACVSYNLMEQALRARLPGTILFDEPHNYLQGRANTYVKTLWKYGGAITYKLALTGTPYLSKPKGLWQLLNIILGMRFGKAKEFDIRYCNGHDGQWGWVNDGATRSDELRGRLKHYMVRRMKADVAKELPKVTRTTRWVEADIRATSALATATHTMVGMRGAVEATLHGKDGELVDIMQDNDRAERPTVVFTWRRTDADRLGALLIKKGVPCMVIHGESNAAERARMVAAAHQLRTHVVTTYGASGQGLDGLQRWISDSVFHAIDPSPAILMQAGGRLDRIGQTQPVTETYLAMEESIDQLTVDKVVNRFEVWQQVMGSDKTSSAIKRVLGDVDNDALLQAIFEEMTK